MIPKNGVCVHFINGEDWEALFILAVRKGYKNIRTDVFWHEVETTKDYFNFEKYLTISSLARKYGVKMLWILAYGNPLYGDLLTLAKSGPTNPDAYAKYCSYAATYLEGDFEIWNEPDHDGFWKQPNANLYVDLSRKASKAIREVNKKALIYSGGLAYTDDLTYLKQMAYTGVFTDGTFDVVAFHPYAGLVSIDLAVGKRAEQIRKIVGDKLKFAVTEIGYKRDWIPFIAKPMPEGLIAPDLTDSFTWKGWATNEERRPQVNYADALGGYSAIRVIPKDIGSNYLYVKGDPGELPVLTQARFRSTNGPIEISLGIEEDQMVSKIFDERWSEPFAVVTVPKNRERLFLAKSTDGVPFEVSYAYSYSRPDLVKDWDKNINRIWEQFRTSTYRVAKENNLYSIFWYVLNDQDKPLSTHREQSFSVI